MPWIGTLARDLEPSPLAWDLRSIIWTLDTKLFGLSRFWAEFARSWPEQGSECSHSMGRDGGFFFDRSKKMCYVCMFCFTFRCLFAVHLFRNIVVQAFARNVRKAEECKTLHPSFLSQIGGSEPGWAKSENTLHWVYLGFQITSLYFIGTG